MKQKYLYLSWKICPLVNCSIKERVSISEVLRDCGEEAGRQTEGQVKKPCILKENI